MPIAIDPKKTWTYVLECDRALPASQQTRWKLKALTVAEHARIADGASSFHRETGTIRIAQGTEVLETLRAGLVGCENFIDAAGLLVQFNQSDEFLSRLRPEWRAELAAAIKDHNTLDADDRKN